MALSLEQARPPLFAKGLTTGEIAAYFAEVYGTRDFDRDPVQDRVGPRGRPGLLRDRGGCLGPRCL